MKRQAQLFVVAILCATTQLLNAQIQTYLQAGILHSTLKSDLFQQDQGRLGFTGGLTFQVPITASISFLPSVAYATKGASVQTSAFHPEFGVQHTSFAYNYNAFEGMMQFGWKPLQDFPLQFRIGAYLDLMSNRLSNKKSNMVLGDLTVKHVGVPITSINEAFSGLDAGPALGLSHHGKHIVIGLHYQQGLVNLYTYTRPNAIGHTIKTSAAFISLAYKLN